MTLAGMRVAKSTHRAGLAVKPKIKVKHVLTGAELSASDLLALIDHAALLKAERAQRIARSTLRGQVMALMFEKPSLRTKFSFTLAMQELGGSVIETHQTHRKSETPEDTARVLAGYVHVIVNRTFSQDVLTRMASVSKAPVINALSDSHHPCQAFGDLLTLKEAFGDLQGLQVAYIGDGNNVLHSLLLLMPCLGVTLRYACPIGYGPDPAVLHRAGIRARAHGGKIIRCSSPQQAAEAAHALYTDVWSSMGFEQEAAERARAFAGFQLNEELYSLADPEAVIMHCMPMVRGEEITDAMADHPNAVLFQQSENRLHAQKALLEMVLG
jgi:ornithine carbamoyltransferase